MTKITNDTSERINPVSGALDVITLGETMALFMADDLGPLDRVERWRKGTAGADSNAAVGLSRLGHRVAWVSRLGTDSFGDYVFKALQDEGIDMSHVQRDATRATGFMLKSRSDDGSDPKVEYFRRGSAASAMTMADFDGPFFARARHFHATGITAGLSTTASALLEHAMRTMRAKGRTVSFDPNLRRALWPSDESLRQRMNELAAHADWVLPGIDEGRFLSGESSLEGVAEHFHRLGASLVVIKLGADGAWASEREGSVRRVVQSPGVRVARVVDTVGAGDGFAAGLISARLDGKSWSEALDRGNWVAAHVVQQRGDVEGLPLRAALPLGSAR